MSVSNLLSTLISSKYISFLALASMSDNYGSSPVYRLNVDVLLKIFHLNANMFIEDNALTNTRHASQVCRTWRATMLDTPTLWARLIDLDSLHDLITIKWPLELIRRSDQAPLWLKAVNRNSMATFTAHRSSMPHILFLSIIDIHWTRIQRIILDSRILKRVHISSSALYRPAPRLDTFHIQSSSLSVANLFCEGHQFMDLFSGSAPMLRHFSVDYKNIDCNASWLRNLRSLKLSGVENICEIFTMLSATRNLEYLQAASSEDIVPHLPRLTVSLPKLKRLDLDLNFEEMAFALDHLAIQAGCSLNLTTHPSTNEGNWRDNVLYTLPPVMSSFSRVAKRYFQCHRAQRVSIRCLKAMFEICDDLRDDHSSFRILCKYFQPSPISAVGICSRFAFSQFASVTKLKFQYDVVSPSAADLTILQYFSSVETLHADEQLFSHITSTQDLISRAAGCRTILFPNLQRIILPPMHGLHRGPIPTGTDVGDDTVKFILSRIKDKHPISVLEITKCNEHATSATLLRLQSIRDLEVVIEMNR